MPALSGTGAVHVYPSVYGRLYGVHLYAGHDTHVSLLMQRKLDSDMRLRNMVEAYLLIKHLPGLTVQLRPSQ